MRGYLAWMLVGLFGCGDDTVEPPPVEPEPETTCAPGELRVEDGSCQPAGLPPDVAPAGPSAPPLAGVPPDGCAMGFVHDGDGGCQAVLPSTPCAPGTMAVPGDSDCREVAPCGSGTWGTIPIATTTEFVDASFTGTSDGSAVAPWTSVQEAINAATSGAIVALAAGSYVESITVTKPLQIWGVCPALVEIVSATPSAAVTIDVAGVELHTLGVRGVGVGIIDRESSTLDRLWVRELGGHGIRADHSITTITGSLVEQAAIAALATRGGTLEVVSSEVRHTQPTANGEFGYGVEIGNDAASAAHARIRGSLFDGNHMVGIGVFGGDLELVATVVRNTDVARSSDGAWGVIVLEDLMPASATIDGSVLAGNRVRALDVRSAPIAVRNTTIEGTLADANGYGEGVYLAQADADIGESVVRDSVRVGIEIEEANATFFRTLIERIPPSPLAPDEGTGITITPGSVVLVDQCVIADSHRVGVYVTESHFTLRDSVVADIAQTTTEEGLGVITVHGVSELERSLIERTKGNGLFVQGAEVTLRSTIVRDSLHGPYSGGGILAFSDETKRSVTQLDGSIIENSDGRGIYIEAGDLDLHATVVRASEAREWKAAFGRGIEIVSDESGQRSTANLEWSVIEEAKETGVFVWGSDVELRGVLVQGITAPPAYPGMGFGIALTGGPTGLEPSRARVVGCRVKRAFVAGIGAFASDVDVEQTLVDDIASRTTDGQWGCCMQAQKWGPQPATLDVLSSAVERCSSCGIGFHGSSGSVVSTSVRDVRASDAGYFGDGISIFLGDVVVDSAAVEHSARAGLAAFGAGVPLKNSTLVCNAFDIASEPLMGTPTRFQDQGNNRCGCPEPDGSCKAMSAGLAPPEELPPPGT